MTCWVSRRTRDDRCQYRNRPNDPGCKDCALQFIDDEGKSPRERERERESARHHRTTNHD